MKFYRESYNYVLRIVPLVKSSSRWCAESCRNLVVLKHKPLTKRKIVEQRQQHL